MAWRLGVIAIFCASALVAGPWEDVVARAREAARSDRNAEAATLFRQAIALDPSRRLEVLRELADQMTYSDEPAAAVPLYREVVAARAGDIRQARLGLALALSWANQLEESLDEYEALSAQDPDDVEALLGRARVLSWLDRNAEAHRVYTIILLRHPNHVEAQRNIARVMSWRDRQREATEILRSFLRSHPGDRQGLFLLGQAQHWMGRHDRAREALDAIERPDRNARNLLDDVARAQTTETRAEGRFSTQSDDLNILRGAIRHAHRLEEGLSQIGVSLEHFEYEPETGRAINVMRPGVAARRRFSDAFEWNGALYLDRVEEIDDVITFDTWATYWPNDFLRFDVSANRFMPDSILSLQRSIVATSLSVSSDLRPSELTSVNVRAARTGFSDGNESIAGAAAFERRVARRPPLRLGARAATFSFDENPGNGYFSPERFLAAALTARMAGRLRDGVWYGVFAAGGYEWITPGDDKPQYAVNANVSWQFTRDFQIELRVDRFSSRQASSSGFARNTVEVGLRYTPIE
jgi:tetratricopeptide (TPR) repeat protein